VPWGGGYVIVYNTDQRWENGYCKLAGCLGASGGGGTKSVNFEDCFCTFRGLVFTILSTHGLPRHYIH
jgi:hypothetical protein